MKIFNKIKEHILSFFNDLKPIQNNKAEESIIKLSDNDGSTEVELHSIHAYKHPGMYELTEADIDEALKKLLSSNNISHLEKEKVMLDIYSDCLTLHKALIPLVALNINYSIDIVGGAVRDFLLNNHKEIKDLDILINLTPSHTNIEYYSRYYVNDKLLNIRMITERNWCTKEELDKVDFSDIEPLYSKHNKLLQICLNRVHSLTSTQIFTKEQRTKTGELLYGEDILKELSGIIKIESKDFNYPIELLLTDKGIDQFYSNIDFGLCNIGLRIINLDEYKHLDLIDFHSIKNNFIISQDFIQDVKNKTITYNTYNRSIDQIEYSFKNHLKRVQAKYPGYNLSFSKNEIDEENQKRIDSVRMMDELSETLAIKEQSTIKPKRNKL
jgi:hypothetical protein